MVVRLSTHFAAFTVALALIASGAAAFSIPGAAPILRSVALGSVCPALRRGAPLPGGVTARTALRMQPNLSDGPDENEERLNSRERQDIVEEGNLLMHQGEDDYTPLEGDIVEFIDPNLSIDPEESTADMRQVGMCVEDAEDGEVLVKALLRREGDGEYDEWRCVIGKQEQTVEVPVYMVRYLGSCTECVVEDGVA